jgi:hypothetical protein
MKILLDESVPKALGYELQGHFVRTVQASNNRVSTALGFVPQILRLLDFDFPEKIVRLSLN